MWVELPEGFDALKLNRALLEEGVQIAVGSIFSASGKYRNCLRMNYAAKPTRKLKRRCTKSARQRSGYWPSADWQTASTVAYSLSVSLLAGASTSTSQA